MTFLVPEPGLPGPPEHRHPLAYTPEELRKLRADLALDPALGVPGAPTTIVRGDAANVGTAVAGRAYSDHRHGAPATATAVALTRTGTAGEGAAANYARSDHVHSTLNMAWGRIGGQTLEANSAVYASGAATDYGFDVSTLDTRNYCVVVSMQMATSGVASIPVRWRQLITCDGVETFQCPPLIFLGNQTGWWSEVFNWKPATDTFTFASSLTRDSGDGSIQIQRSVTKKGIIEVYDMGPRT